MFCYECIQTAYQHDRERKCPLCREPGGNHSLEELTLEDPVGEIVEETTCYISDIQGNTVEMPKEIHDRITQSAEQMGGKIDTLFDMIQKK